MVEPGVFASAPGKGTGSCAQIAFPFRLFTVAESNCIGRCVSSAVRDAQQNIADAQTLGMIFGAAAHHDLRLAVRVVPNLYVSPGHAPAPARAQAFQDGFLGCPASGEMLRGMFSR